MKTKLILIALLTLLFAPFAQAGAPEKIIAVTMHKGMSVLQFYNHNQNYRTVYTPEAFKNKLCVNNPQVFKKCTDGEFRHIQAEKVLYFPTLPEAKSGTAIKQVYQKNEVYRVLFGSFSKFQQEICKNNPEKIEKCTKTALKNLKTNEDLKITPRPETYLISGEESDSITIGGKTFTKAAGGYYRIGNKISDVPQIKEGGASTTKEHMPAQTSATTTSNQQETLTTDTGNFLSPSPANHLFTSTPFVKEPRKERRRE